MIFGLICLVVTLFYPDVRENITKGSPLSYIIVLILTVSLSQDLLPIYKLYKLLKSDSMPKKMPHIFKIINGEIQVVKRIQD